MEVLEGLWTRIVPGEVRSGGPVSGPEDRKKFGPEREYDGAATYAAFARTCRRKESVRIFRELAERKRLLARWLMTEEYLQSGVRPLPGRALYDRPTPEALRGMYHYERETAEAGERAGARYQLAMEAAQQLRTLLEKAMP